MRLIPLLSLCTGFFMVIMDAAIVNVALPNIATGLNTTISWLQWIVNGYTLMFASLLLMAGYMSDQFGAKKLFQGGVVVFTLVSFLCGLSNSAWMLTLFRFLQGAAAAFMVPTSLALLNASFPDEATRARAIGIWASTGGIALTSGPIIGAVLTALFSWHAIFFVNIFFGLISFIFTAIFVMNPMANPPENKFDSIGQLFGIISIAALAFVLIEIGPTAWYSSKIIVSFCVFMIGTIGFIITELKVKAPMLPLKFFKHKNFSISAIAGMVINISFYGALFILPLYFHRIRHYTVMMTGLALLPFMVTCTFSSYFSGKISAVIGPKAPMRYGLFLAGIGFIIMVIIVKYELLYPWFIIAFVIASFGLGLVMPAATVAIIRSVSHHQAGMASGVFNTSRQIGSLIGVAIFGTIIVESSVFIFGVELSFIIAAVVLLFACLLTMWMLNDSSDVSIN
ncbi:MAG: MFS transporter [Pseudomonadota bacterium]